MQLRNSKIAGRRTLMYGRARSHYLIKEVKNQSLAVESMKMINHCPTMVSRPAPNSVGYFCRALWRCCTYHALGPIRTSVWRFGLLITAILISTTATSSASPGSPLVDAHIASTQIVILNRSPQFICFAIHEADSLTRIEWGPSPECFDGGSIEPKKTIDVPFKIGDYDPSGTAVVSWWYKGENVTRDAIRVKIPKAQPGAPPDAKSMRR